MEMQPYYLHPDIDPKGEPFEDYCKRTWGSSSWSIRCREAGKKAGLAFGDWKWWSNTMDLHRMVKMYSAAHPEEPNFAIEWKLFLATYEEGKNLGDRDAVVAIGEEMGIPDVRRRLYETEEFKEDVLLEDKFAKRKLRIDGVPHFIFENTKTKNKLQCSGAQPPETFLEIFNEVLSEQ